MLECTSCNGLGYIEYETGVFDNGIFERVKEPCECQQEVII